MPECSYDGAPLTFDAEGREESCPTCEADIASHLARCGTCRAAPYLPEAGGLDLTRLGD